MVLIKKSLIQKVLFLFVSIVISGQMSFAQNYTISGQVIDKVDETPLEFVNIYMPKSKLWATTDKDGKFQIKRVPSGDEKIQVSYLGYFTQVISVKVSKDIPHLKIALQEKSNKLKEVVITATESDGVVTSSKIGRSAMRHLQPSSFTDLLELLPGGVSKDPDMGSANTITLRETGFIKSDGTKGKVSDDYAITSLGTQFVIDGIPMNTDANLQASPIGGGFESSRSVVNKGVDMRTISTDDIEKVEIIRGIPSAEYGNLTSGVINIEKIRRKTPLTARFKADGYSKLFSVGKGIALSKGNDNILNVDLGYFDAKPDPRNNLVNYKRVNTSLRYTMRRQLDIAKLKYSANLDYSGSFDNAKEDSELNHGDIDNYKSTYNRIVFNNSFSWQFPYLNGIKGLDLNTSVNAQFDRLERDKLVAPQRYMIVPNTSEAGEHDATLLFKEYVADFLSDGKPFNAFIKLKSNFSFNTSATKHDIKVGGEWSYTKNFGRGQVYDLNRPLQAGVWSSRPRAYKDIPDLQNLNFFAEELFTANMGSHKLELMGGLRSLSLIHLDKKYSLNGKIYLDPRVNGLWHFPKIAVGKQLLSVAIGGGVGKTTKMPTLDYLFPDLFYHDIIQLGYYDTNKPEEYSRFNVRSYISDRTNYDLRPARNLKWEVRTDIAIGTNRLSMSYFREKMNSGFRYMANYMPYLYKEYDATAIKSSELQGPPDLATLPYVEKTVLDGYNRAANGSQLKKEGVEFQFHSQRIKPLYTTINLNGAWFRSTYNNSQRMMRTVSEVIDGQSVSDKYVGYYNWDDGNVYNQFNTNLLLDTQVPQWGLIFSTSLQFMWFTSKQTLEKDGTPEAYLSAEDGLEHPYTEASAEDIFLQHLIIPFNKAQFDKYTVPMSFIVNLKVTKTIGQHMKLAFFANKLIDHTPNFESNGMVVRRNVKPYFGMELNFSL